MKQPRNLSDLQVRELQRQSHIYEAQLRHATARLKARLFTATRGRVLIEVNGEGFITQLHIDADDELADEVQAAYQAAHEDAKRFASEVLGRRQAIQ